MKDILIFGVPRAGKTTLSKLLIKELENSIVIYLGHETLSPEEILKNIRKEKYYERTRFRK